MPLEKAAAMHYLVSVMHILTAIAISAIAWVATIGILLFGLFKEHLPAEETNMVFYLFLQAAVPTAVFWFMTHK